jgi:hypothetical protein
VFEVLAAGVTLSGLTIRDGYHLGAPGQVGALGAGGAIRNVGTLTLVTCSLLNNRAVGGYSATSEYVPATGGPGYGGAIYNQGTVTLRNCTLSGNAATGGDAFNGLPDTSGSGLGGAIYNFGTASLVNCTISGNTAAAGFYGMSGIGAGAGLYNAGKASLVTNTSTATLLNCTVAGNRATGLSGSRGGGLYTQDRAANKTARWNQIRIQNTIVAVNVAAIGSDLAGGFLSNGNNVLSKVDGSTGWVATDRGGTNASPLSARLYELANNGGKTDTRALMAGSVAINAGNASVAPSTDQRGAVRSGLPDIGAFEYGVVVP